MRDWRMEIKRIKRPWQASVISPKEHDAFYDSGPWRKLRRAKLKLNPMCEYCAQKKEPKHVWAKVVDHYLPRVLWPHLSLHPPNLRSCCDQCHQRKRNIERNYKLKDVIVTKFKEHGFE